MSNIAEAVPHGPPTSSEPHGHIDPHKFSVALGLIALGIVFGDIGTSPLYAFNEVFAHGLAVNLVHVLGPLDLIFWGLMLPITVKYVSLALRINSEGEGGTFALYRILRELPQRKPTVVISTLLILGAGLLYADGSITPAISVSSAVEGLNTLHPIFSKISMPITIVILTALFAFQRKGTDVVGKLFGWIMLAWFLAIGAIGLSQAIHQPAVWMFWNPMYAFKFLEELTPFERFEALGYVMLAYTGGEALYADLGHVGAPAIRWCWIFLVFPCLMLNYLGQGAFLLDGGHYNKAQSLFYAIIPHHFLIPMILLGACATCIASQALISGAASLTALASGLNLLPRIKILHTSAEHKGQIYLPFLNGALWVACIGIVLGFKTAGAMANAYGLAVACDMVITSLALSQAAPFKLGWTPLKAALIFGAFAIFDSTMLVSNSLKFLAGGWVPAMIAIVLFLMMKIWQRGRRLVKRLTATIDTMTLREYLVRLDEAESADFVHLYLINSAYRNLDEKIPMSLNDNVLEPGYGASTHFPSSIIFLNIKVSGDQPFVRDDQRFEASRVTQEGFQPLPSINLSGCALPHHKQAVTRGTSNAFMVTIHYGYMETPDMVGELRTLQHRLGITHSPKRWGRFVDRLTLDMGDDLTFMQYLELLLFSRMRRWTSPIYDFYGLSRIGTVHGVRLLQFVYAKDLRIKKAPEPVEA